MRKVTAKDLRPGMMVLEHQSLGIDGFKAISEVTITGDKVLIDIYPINDYRQMKRVRIPADTRLDIF